MATKKKAASAVDNLPANKVSKKSKAEPKTLPEEVPGWDLLVDFAEVPVWEQAPLLDFVEDITKGAQVDYSSWSKQDLLDEVAKRNEESAEDEDIDEIVPASPVNKGNLIMALKADDAVNGSRADVSLRVIGDLAKALLPYAKDKDAYTKFVSGGAGLKNAASLGMAWVGQMGGSSSSDD